MNHICGVATVRSDSGDNRPDSSLALRQLQRHAAVLWGLLGQACSVLGLACRTVIVTLCILQCSLFWSLPSDGNGAVCISPPGSSPPLSR